FRNWKDICEQPFEVTARIPIKDVEILPDDAPVAKSVRKVVKRKKPVRRKQEKTMTSVSQVRLR
ncbi:MAG: hypothetical protein WC369_08820, partial [Dehalococcoidales bacterium]